MRTGAVIHVHKGIVCCGHKPLLQFANDYEAAKYLFGIGYNYLGRDNTTGLNEYFKR